MNISNEKTTVPDRVRELLLSRVPFGSEYVVYCSGDRTYDLLYNNFNSNVVHHFRVSSSGYGSDYVLTSLSDETYSGYTVENPYYCYASQASNGIKTTLPITNDIICFALIICACLAILKTVFGGIKLWSNRKKSYV